MFMGEFAHNIDAKGRLIVPAKFRNELGSAMIVTRGLWRLSLLYTKEAWDKIYAQLLALPTTKKEVRMYVRTLTLRPVKWSWIIRGRILIPQFLIKEAAIVKECVIVGVADKVEIWSKERWEAYSDSADDEFESIAESITDFIIWWNIQAYFCRNALIL